MEYEQKIETVVRVTRDELDQAVRTYLREDRGLSEIPYDASVEINIVENSHTHEPEIDRGDAATVRFERTANPDKKI